MSRRNQLVLRLPYFLTAHYHLRLHYHYPQVVAGAAANSAEQAKKRKYQNHGSSLIFVPFGVAFRDMGTGDMSSKKMLKELPYRVNEST
ncbi:jg1724 [Pararge aegeria aegeria]|uniref:Jg1724 protein n=1 Tax=Pararge aegeria aegeria TaxID=348720 RepID=A0A8S4SPC3_9NEOP|nr:jg1724 [Pararge aegeria aegeria]